MLTTIISPPWWIILIVVYIIYNYGWKNKTWERKRDLLVKTIVVIIIILLPFSFLGIYNLAGIENRGKYEGTLGSFSLRPGETYTSETLSNRFTVIHGFLDIQSDNVTVYFLDENLPEIHYNEVTCLYRNIVDIELPYLYTDFSTPANWTLNIYNPSQIEQVGGIFEIYLYDYGVIGPTPPNPFLIYYLPTIILFFAWITWGVITGLAYWREMESLRPKDEHTENAEIQDDEDYESPEEHKYKRIRERKR